MSLVMAVMLDARQARSGFATWPSLVTSYSKGGTGFGSKCASNSGWGVPGSKLGLGPTPAFTATAIIFPSPPTKNRSLPSPRQPALHGGYFLRRQYDQFLGRHDGGAASQLIEKALAQGGSFAGEVGQPVGRCSWSGGSGGASRAALCQGDVDRDAFEGFGHEPS